MTPEQAIDFISKVLLHKTTMSGQGYELAIQALEVLSKLSQAPKEE